MTETEAPGRRVRFLKDFDYKPTPRITVAYKAGQLAFVPLKCAEQAIAKGRAETVELAPPGAGIAAKVSARRRRKKADG